MGLCHPSWIGVYKWGALVPNYHPSGNFMADNNPVATTFEQSVRSRKKSGKRLAGKVVVQILPTLEKGGVERGTIEMADAVIREGGRAVVISNGGQLVSRLLRLGGEHYDLPVHTKNPLKWFFIRRHVRDVLVKTGADIVHIRSRAPAWIALPVAKAMKIPVVTTIHGRLRRVNPFKKIYNSIMMRGDRVIAISNYIYRMVMEQFPYVADRLLTIHRGVDIDIFSPENVSAQRVIRISNMLDIPDDCAIVMLPARPTDWKGADLLIEAASKLNDINFVVLLIGAADGTDDYQQGLIKMIKSHDLSGKVRLCQGVDDMAAALMLADVVLMPSRSPEPFGRVAIEASAMGCPVIAFNHGGAAESILPGVTGWLAEPVSATSLAECLKEAITMKPRARMTLSKKAREFVGKNFNSTKMCDETIGIYEKLMARRRRA